MFSIQSYARVGADISVPSSGIAGSGYSWKIASYAAGGALVGGYAANFFSFGSTLFTIIGSVVGFSVPIIIASPMFYEPHGVPNLVEVSTGVWRSGQPNTPEAWAYLKSLGIKRVIKLNSESEGSDKLGKDIGIEVIDAAIPPHNGVASSVLETPDRAIIKRAVKELSKGDSLVHCMQGQDRTGTIVGVYRVLHDGWTKQQAFDEMMRNHFHWEIPGLMNFWKLFDPKDEFWK